MGKENWATIQLECRYCRKSFSVWSWRTTQKYCSRKCEGESRVTPPLSRLNYKINDHGCWLWQGAVSTQGYARMSVRRKTVSVHALVYEAKYGPIAEGLEFDHVCRVRQCINPDHLEPVTSAENTRRGERWRRDEKGRLLSSSRVVLPGSHAAVMARKKIFV